MNVGVDREMKSVVNGTEKLEAVRNEYRFDLRILARGWHFACVTSPFGAHGSLTISCGHTGAGLSLSTATAAPPLMAGEDNAGLVIHSGSGICKGASAGDDTSRAVFSFIVGRAW
ncbi:Actin-2 [Echinococcus granulosus]|uniref:Actin-2 n=1 Tax=Echinococcus granulosus TaxID=6210 RepID=W6ULY6_ECHGR|nr:Actin-2 [Echinococcus granulosus]EUB54494.1 Actin-2 [Echinococcus granulosus]